ncbi:MAG: hypothetical protein ACFE8B_10845, partial [Candidatus Hermodarchaeota archaeon]
LKNLDGEFVNWFSPQNKNWPTEDDFSDDNNFLDLIEKFNMNLERVAVKIKNINLMDRIEIGAPPEATYFRILLVFLQHASYHLGQLVTTRKLLGDWKGG